MYFLILGLLLAVLPAGSVCVEMFLLHNPGVTLLVSVGRWWTFWAVGIRLFIAGLRQTIQPEFTATTIFRCTDPLALPIVREVGFGNLAMGTLGICSLMRTGWVAPAAVVGGLYYGLAALGHIGQKNKNAAEWTALVSDFGVFLILAVFVSCTFR